MHERPRVARGRHVAVIEHVRGDPRRAVVAGRIVAQHFAGERRVRVGQRAPEQAQVAPRAAAQIDERAGAEVGVRRRCHRVEAVREHAEQRGVVPLLGALVDRLGALPRAPREVRAREHVEQRRAIRGLAAIVHGDEQLADAQPRRCEPRCLGGDERVDARELLLGRRLRGELLDGDGLAQRREGDRAGRHVDLRLLVVVVVVAVGRLELRRARLGIVLREVALEQLAQRRIARVDRAFEIAECEPTLAQGLRRLLRRACARFRSVPQSHAIANRRSVHRRGRPRRRVVRIGDVLRGQPERGERRITFARSIDRGEPDLARPDHRPHEAVRPCRRERDPREPVAAEHPRRHRVGEVRHVVDAADAMIGEAQHDRRAAGRRHEPQLGARRVHRRPGRVDVRDRRAVGRPPREVVVVHHRRRRDDDLRRAPRAVRVGDRRDAAAGQIHVRRRHRGERDHDRGAVGRPVGVRREHHRAERHLAAAGPDRRAGRRVVQREHALVGDEHAIAGRRERRPAHRDLRRASARRPRATRADVCSVSPP